MTVQLDLAAESVQVSLDRSGPRGTERVWVIDLPGGVTAERVTVPEGSSAVDVEIVASSNAEPTAAPHTAYVVVTSTVARRTFQAPLLVNVVS